MAEPAFSDQELDRAVEALSDPERFRAAEERVSRVAPQLQRILNDALHSGGWFDQAQESQVREAASAEDQNERIVAVRTLLAEETRLGMLVGVALGWELARELELRPPPTE